MKSKIAFITAVSFIFSACTSFSVNAAGEKYVPKFYFKAENNSDIEFIGEDTVKINSNVLKNGDVALDIGVYVEDTELGIYNISAKWNCDSEFIHLGNIVDPKADTGATKEYKTSSGKSFSTNLTPFAYGVIDENNEMKVPYTVDIAEDGSPLRENCGENACGFTYNYISFGNPTAFEPLGKSSDEFALTSFDAVIESEIPEGIYEIYFMTAGNHLSTKCGGSFLYNADGLGNDFFPKVRNLKVIVSDKNFILGDVDFDGHVDSSDASTVLKDYALTSTKKDSIFSDMQKFVADVNSDGASDASDASSILAYYANKATGGSYNTIEEFLNR